MGLSGRSGFCVLPSPRNWRLDRGTGAGTQTGPMFLPAAPCKSWKGAIRSELCQIGLSRDTESWNQRPVQGECGVR